MPKNTLSLQIWVIFVKVLHIKTTQIDHVMSFILHIRKHDKLTDSFAQSGWERMEWTMLIHVHTNRKAYFQNVCQPGGST